MKRIIMFLMAMSALFANGQPVKKVSTTADRATIKDSLKLGNKWVKGVVTDTTFAAIADNTIPTTRAVKKYVDSRPVGDTTNLSNRINAKQNALASGTNIKTVNGTSLLGSGDLTIAGGGGTVDDPTIAQLGYVTNMSALKASTLYTAGGTGAIKQIKLLGYFRNNDNGGGDFVWNPYNNDPDDGGSVIKPSAVSGAGRWERVVDNSYVPAIWFGAKDDYTRVENIHVDATTSRLYKYHKFVNLGNLGSYRMLFLHSDGDRISFYGIGTSLASVTALVGKTIWGTFQGKRYNLGVASTPELWLSFAPSIHLSNPHGYTFDGDLTVIEEEGAITTNLPIDSCFQVGKLVTIEGSRLYSALRTEPVELTVVITGVFTNYVEFTNLNVGQGALYETPITYGNEAHVYTENTTQIVNALKCQSRYGLSHVQLGTNKTCIFPYYSSVWTSLDSYQSRKYVFKFENNNSLIGNLVVEGRNSITPTYDINGPAAPSTGALGWAPPSSPSVGDIYTHTTTGIKWIWSGVRWEIGPVTPPGSPTLRQIYQEGTNDIGAAWKWNGTFWELQKYSAVYLYQITLFHFTPIANTTSFPSLSNLNIELPAIPEVESHYRLFDDWSNQVIRHGMQVNIDNVNVTCPTYNFKILDSNGGGVYDSDFNIIYKAGYNITNSKFIGSGMCFNIKSADDLPTGKAGGKYLNLKDVEVDGASLNTQKSVVTALTYTNTGGEYFLETTQSGFSWWDFNMHSQYSYANNTVFKPYCRVRKRFLRTISAITKIGDQLIVTMDSPAPTGTSNSHGECIIGLNTKYQCTSLYTGLGAEKQFGTVVTAGSATLTINGMWDVEDYASLVGKEVRVYYAFDDVKVGEIINPKKARIMTGGTTTCLNGTELDMLVNYGSLSPINSFFHFVYGGSNITYNFTDVKIKNALKLFLRISPESSAGQNKSFFKNLSMLPITGVNALCTGTNKYTAYSQTNIELDMENCSVLLNGGTIYGGNFKNTELAGNPYGSTCSVMGILNATNCKLNYLMVKGGKTILDNCTGNIIMKHQTDDALADANSSDVTIYNSDIDVSWLNGNIKAENSSISITEDHSNSTIFNTAIESLNGVFNRCNIKTFKNTFFNSTSNEMKKWSAAIRYNECTYKYNLIPPATINNYGTEYIQFANKKYPTPVVFINIAYPADYTIYPPRIGRTLGYISSAPNNALVTRYGVAILDMNILFISPNYNYYEVNAGASHITGIFLGCNVPTDNFSFLDVMQRLLKVGEKLTIKNVTAGTIYKLGMNIKSSTLRPRTAGELLHFTYDGVNWIEDYQEQFASAAPSYSGVTGEFVRNSTTSAVLGWSFNGTSWVVINR